MKYVIYPNNVLSPEKEKHLLIYKNIVEIEINFL